MLNKALEFVIGDISGKKEYRQLEKRINQLPKEYNVAFKKIRKYMYTVSAPNGDMEVFNDLTIFVNMLELFEEAVAEGKRVNEVIGNDADQFADNLMLANSKNPETTRTKLNAEIQAYFQKEEKNHVK